MNRLSDEISAWGSARLNFAKVNDRFLIDPYALASITDITLRELGSAGIHIPNSAQESISPLLSVLLINERDQRRALVGNFAIELSPTNVAGGIIAAISLLVWLVGAGGLLSAEAGVAIASAVQAVTAAISRLSPVERAVVSAILTVKHFRPIVTLDNVVTAANDPSLTPAVVVGIMLTLRDKGAVSWLGAADSPIEIIKWF